MHDGGTATILSRWHIVLHACCRAFADPTVNIRLIARLLFCKRHGQKAIRESSARGRVPQSVGRSSEYRRGSEVRSLDAVEQRCPPPQHMPHACSRCDQHCDTKHARTTPPADERMEGNAYQDRQKYSLSVTMKTKSCRKKKRHERNQLTRNFNFIRTQHKSHVSPKLPSTLSPA